MLSRWLRIAVSPLEEALIGEHENSVSRLGMLECNGLDAAETSGRAAGGYIGWQEQCSHSGKPVPFSSLLAPLAPLYNNLLGRQWDR